MLGKVMKYEFKSAGRLLLPFFGLALAMSALMRGMQALAAYVWEPLGEILKGLANTVGTLAVLTVPLLCLVWLVVRFYQSMASGEAYLTFTLPVSVDAHLAGRLAVGVALSLAGMAVALLCALIFVPGLTKLPADIVRILVTAQGHTETFSLGRVPPDIWASAIGLILLVAVASVLYSLLQIFTAMGLGSALSQKPILGGIVAYLALGSAQSLLSLLLTVPLMLVFGANSAEVAAYFQGLITGDLIGSARNILGAVWMFCGAILFINAVFAAVYYCLCRYCFGKKLNLE